MMLRSYLVGAIEDAITRARQLVEIAHDCQLTELTALRQVCSDHLNEVILKLVGTSKALASESANLPSLMRTFQAMVAEIDEAESVGVFALKNPSDEDVVLNQMLIAIAREITYPLIHPTVSHTSQSYFEISTKFNLLRVPLIEGRFFLHLPDLYHELCHPLLRSKSGLTNPKLDPLRKVFLGQKIERGRALDLAILKGRRRRAGEELGYRNALWRKCWMETWMEELFCDAFGAFTAGPAYAWSNFHLCARSGRMLYSVPRAVLSSHPANHARMVLMLKVLCRQGFEQDAAAIERAWSDYAIQSGAEKSPTYDLCYPDEVLAEIANAATTGFEACGISGLTVDNQPKIGALLQNAWFSFWSPATDYADWEVDQKAELVNYLG